MENFDFVSAWEMIASFFDRLVAWLFCVIGGGEWNPDYGK